MDNILENGNAMVMEKTVEAKNCPNKHKKMYERLRMEMESELEELTASLFQEAHNMVREANEKQAAAEKALKESQMKVDVLQAEVSALKTLVITSTPSRPNLHVKEAKKHHRRSPSHFNLKYGRSSSPNKEELELPERELLEVDPVFYDEFIEWKREPTFDKGDPFIRKIYAEDIERCLAFDGDAALSARVRHAVENNAIFIEEAKGEAAAAARECALLGAPRKCCYRMNIGEPDAWYCISRICRNRIIAVCDFLNYLKYIEKGLVKSSADDIYWEIIRLRKAISLSRLGLGPNS